MEQELSRGARPLYRDIAERTQGDMYIGVVGPVRTGKSTFIARFMEQMVLPFMAPGPRRDRLTDELPQSGSGRTIMTTQPKFIPGEGAAEVTLEPRMPVRVRMVDSVGYLIPGALGSALADLILGYGLYVPATAIIKGLMGLMAGTLCLKAEKVWQRIVWMAVAEAWMVAGYFLFETCLYGAATAAASLLGNAFQGVAGLVCGAVLWPLMGRVRKTLG